MATSAATAVNQVRCIDLFCMLVVSCAHAIDGAAVEIHQLTFIHNAAHAASRSVARKGRDVAAQHEALIG